jgi:hypothetical protein
MNFKKDLNIIQGYHKLYARFRSRLLEAEFPVAWVKPNAHDGAFGTVWEW